VIVVALAATAAPPWRVNATSSQFEEFAEAFGCEEGLDAMASGTDCRVW
jgi:hypothetical protein